MTTVFIVTTAPADAPWECDGDPIGVFSTMAGAVACRDLWLRDRAELKAKVEASGSTWSERSLAIEQWTVGAYPNGWVGSIEEPKS